MFSVCSVCSVFQSHPDRKGLICFASSNHWDWWIMGTSWLKLIMIKMKKLYYKGNSWRTWHWLGKELFTVNIESPWLSWVLVLEASLSSQVFSLLKLDSEHRYYVYCSFGSDKSLLAFQKYTFAISVHSLVSSRLNCHRVPHGRYLSRIC